MDAKEASNLFSQHVFCYVMKNRMGVSIITLGYVLEMLLSKLKKNDGKELLIINPHEVLSVFLRELLVT